MNVNFTPQARDDLLAIRDWIAAELAREYPGAYVEARPAQAPQSVDVDVEFDFDDEDDYQEAQQLRRQVAEFCAGKSYRNR